MSLTSDEVNFLVYRYLLESGFQHSAFSFAHESLVTKSNIETSKVPPGALISFIQKGLQYCEVESHINDDGTETVCDEGFSVLAPHKCSARSKKRLFNPYEPLDGDYGPLEVEDEALLWLHAHADLVCVCLFNPIANLLASGSTDSTARIWDVELEARLANHRDEENKDEKNNLVPEGGIILSHTPQSTPAAPAKKKKKGRAPKGKKDDDEKDKDEQTASAAASSPSANSVLAMDWNSSGTLLCCGCYSGRVVLWSVAGQLLSHHHIHTGPLSCVHFNPTGSALLSCGVDGRALIWKVASSSTSTSSSSSDPSSSSSAANGLDTIALPVLVMQEQLALPQVPVLDGSWRGDDCLALAAADGSIYIAVLMPATTTTSASSPASSSSASTPSSVMRIAAHQRDVNSVRWSPDGRWLASASDDASVKLWSLTNEGCVLHHDLQGHERAVNVVRWSPTGPGTEQANLPLLLASASLDTTVRVWEPESGQCVYTLSKHIHPVTAIAFNPTGELLASAAHDRVYIWLVKDALLIKTFKSEAGITDLSWTANGQQIAVSYSDGSICVIDIRS